MPTFPELSRAIEAAAKRLPSISVHVRQMGRPCFHRTLGHACLLPSRAATHDQTYDLASLTKPLVTSTVCASLTAAGILDVDAPLRDVLPTVHEALTPWHLLCHTGGYPAWEPLYRSAGAMSPIDRRAEVLRAALDIPLAHAPGEQHTYSDIGFLVLLHYLESLTGQRLDALFQTFVSQPAQLSGLCWGDPMAAATERCPERQRIVEGEVHDLNAAAMGGISSHAGLFGSARDVTRLVDTLITPSSALHDAGSVLRGWWSREAAGTHRGGWDTPSASGYTSTGGALPADAVGHLGYTGTSVWSSPSERVVIAILTNRVHPHDDLTAIREVRPAIHQALARDLGWDEPNT